MSATIDSIIDGVIKAEGGYSNDANDSGGETMYGITATVARANGYLGAMRDLPITKARQIYNDRYVVVPQFDKVAAIDAQIGAELVDTGVNMGPGRSAEFLQRWLNGFNDTGSRYQSIFVDSRIGPISLAALSAFLKWRGADGRTALLRGLNSIQANRYLEITEANTTQRKFLFGWIMNRVQIV